MDSFVKIHQIKKHPTKVRCFLAPGRIWSRLSFRFRGIRSRPGLRGLTTSLRPSRWLEAKQFASRSTSTTSRSSSPTYSSDIARFSNPGGTTSSCRALNKKYPTKIMRYFLRPAGFEPAISRSATLRSIRAELRAHNFLTSAPSRGRSSVGKYNKIPYFRQVIVFIYTTKRF